MTAFKNIIDFQREFSTEEKCREYLELQLWNGTPACPFCGSTNVHRFPNNRIFKCRERLCRNKFSVTVGTIYENTKMPLTKWFLATYILSVHSKGMSSHQLANWLGITQKSAWHMNHRIREMLKEDKCELLDEIVEVDTVYIGGSESFKLKSKRKVKGGTKHKTMILGAIQRGGKLMAKVTPQQSTNVCIAIEEFVTLDSTLITDEHHDFNGIRHMYDHRRINHREKEYVRTEEIKVHTNSIEGFWNILKKQINGIHHYVSPKHLQRYCNESTFKYNNRQLSQEEKFAQILANCHGSLKYNDLINKNK